MRRALLDTSRGRRGAESTSLLGLQKVLHKCVELLLRELGAEVLGHDVRLVALGHLGVGVNDRLADERGVHFPQLAQVRAHLCSRAGGRERVAARAAVGGEELLAVRRRRSAATATSAAAGGAAAGGLLLIG